MIPDFKTFIKESIWSDIQDRSSGETERKEDDVNLLDCEELYNYIKTHYELKDEHVVRLASYGESILIELKGGIFDSVSVQLNFNDWPARTDKKCFILNPDDFSKDLLTKIKDKYFINRQSNVDKRVYPKDDSDATNTFLLDVLDLVISDFEEHDNNKLMIRKKK